MRYGLLDTQDNLWLGGADGPKLFEEELMARFVAQLTDVRMKWSPGRTRATAFPEAAPVKLRDEVQFVRDAKWCLDRMEKGLV